VPRPAKVIVHFGQPLRFARGEAGRTKEHYRETAAEIMRAIERLMAAEAGAVPARDTRTRAWTPPPAATTNPQGGSGQV
jgi:hypothetical protein